jgi:hypothetical protein
MASSQIAIMKLLTVHPGLLTLRGVRSFVPAKTRAAAATMRTLASTIASPPA